MAAGLVTVSVDVVVSCLVISDCQYSTLILAIGSDIIS